MGRGVGRWGGREDGHVAAEECVSVVPDDARLRPWQELIRFVQLGGVSFRF